MRSQIVKDLIDVEMDSDMISALTIQAALVLLILSLSTHCFTTFRYLLQSSSNRRYKGKEPLTLPYQIPGVGSALELIRNPHGFFDAVADKSGGSEPVRLRLGNLHAYLIYGDKNVQHLFRCSRDLTFEEFALRVAQKVKRLPASDSALVAKDLSGSSRVPLTDTPDEDRIWRKFHEIYESHLIGGTAVTFLTDMFIKSLVDQLKTMDSGEWMLCGVDEFMKEKMFRASTTALAGPGVFQIDPGFTEKFWNYDHDFMSLLYGLPRFLCRKGADARDSCLETVKTYLENGWRNTDWCEVDKTDANWEPNFGSKLVREREAAMEKYGISLQGRASFQMGLIWSINSNAIPMTSWIVIEILSRPHIFEKIKAEVASVVNKDAITKGSINTDGTASRILDIAGLKKLPLLNSVYLECLRLRSSVFVVRKLRNSIEVDGYTLKQGNLILAPSYIAHKDPDVWSSPSHPPEEFWPERFLQGAPRSNGTADGQKNHANGTATANGGAIGSTFSAGKFFPYGGGSAMCPGRNYAKQEILAAVALFFAFFDIEVLHYVDKDGNYSQRGPEVGKDARGVAKIDRDLLVRLRRI